MKIYVDEMPKSCAECEFCGKLKPPVMRPEIECMHCNLMKKLDTRSDFCPLNLLVTCGQEQNQKAIEQLEKVKEKFGYKHNSQLVISSKNLVGFIDQQINELKGEVKDVKD